ncbi:hypothetical protein [Neomicrococcus aestuarii]|uniref:Uncharacterized protein n=1 Tax=Neomicrococcus aestuarii TaxID=556325 RepID=A0A1L2ZNQ0_9MICC|nr:hypothetical protein [Neomicrococcus aestuarii]APF41004.1 hypothetical protein BHE16_08330 [Neomicrococcus aestuarii]
MYRPPSLIVQQDHAESTPFRAINVSANQPRAFARDTLSQAASSSLKTPDGAELLFAGPALLTSRFIDSIERR